MGYADQVVFRWLERDVRVESERSGVLDEIRRRWGNAPERFDRPARHGLHLRVVEQPDGGLAIVSPSGRVAVDRDHPGIHVFTRMASELLDMVSEQFVFHGTVVADDVGATIISGPSGFGKSTLGIRLTACGRRWLADDLAIVDRATGRVVPFERPVRLRPGTRATLSAAVLDGARSVRVAVDGEDWIVPPAGWLPCGRRAAPIRAVVLLRPVKDDPALRQFPLHTVRFCRGRAELADEVRRLPGIDAARVDGHDPLRVELDVGDPGPLTAWLDRHRDDLVLSIKSFPAPAHFDGEPVVTPLGRFEAAVELSQEMVNRHGSGALAREYDGRPAELVADVAETLRDARCISVVPGRLDDTVRCLEDALGG